MKTKGSYPSEEAVTKPVYVALAWIIQELLCGDPKPFALQGLQTFSLNDSTFLYT
ncbi:hypothetical protein KR51_00012150 [Rubidibacter lacunae KORDI 51-2]|uniref:Uncharacterized protein n=1 Tax=Rubidibacter lacunae KORDI 51-2 TaxID=582515 RepID=U5DR24_9CHRO|nr:hypothetical protein KR51_00012150 [Rubidibacter lacunae KORDI 51-2]